jgi:hypothetical protein
VDEGSEEVVARVEACKVSGGRKCTVNVVEGGECCGFGVGYAQSRSRAGF